MFCIGRHARFLSEKHHAKPQIFVDWLSDQVRASDAQIARLWTNFPPLRGCGFFEVERVFISTFLFWRKRLYATVQEMPR